MKIAYLCPYFGKFPNHFQLWLNSCGMNKDCTWFVFTDDKRIYDYPENVKVEYLDLVELKNRFQTKFDFEIKLESIRKLGDYKPLFGYLFNEYIEGYKAWGHVDVNDSIYGNISKFITDEMIDSYDKIMCCGHMSIYKNTQEVNELFMTNIPGLKNYREIFSNPEFMNFEEIGENSITSFFLKSNKRIKNLSGLYADISYKRYQFRLGGVSEDFTKYYWLPFKRQIFSWENGHIYSYIVNGNFIEKKEYLYLHVKRRRIELHLDNLSNVENFMFTQSGFIPFEINITKKFIKKNDKVKLIYYIYIKDVLSKKIKRK